MPKTSRLLMLAGGLLCLCMQAFAQFMPVGNGSYTTAFPGTDQAGRNGFPSGTPQISGNAVGKPVPTNDWWSAVVKENHAGNLFNYPMAMKTVPSGLVASYIPWGVFDDQEPIIVGVSGLNASKATVSDYSDWTVTMDWAGKFQATSGIAMPFLYFNKQSTETARVQINLGSVTVDGEVIMVENARNGANFVIYAPAGSTWTQQGNVYTSSLNGQNYWSMAMMPQGAPNLSALAAEYQAYAYVFPANTTAEWSFDEGSSVVRTVFAVEAEVKEGTAGEVLLGLLPHQWAHLAGDSPQPDGRSYRSVRGEIKTLAGNSFTVENKFHGILPTLPYLSNYSEGFSVSALNAKVEQLQHDGLSAWTDSYNEGQMMNRLIQTARIAHEMGNTAARDNMVATIKERLEDWLSAEASEVAFLFYYNSDWSALLGYPAGHGQDSNLNDHHFHWGYFIHAAAFMEQFEPGWAAQWGGMIDHLVRDAASPDRNDELFPYLRNFSPYAGHCWANGFATFPQGNDQESTSESMQFNSSLIHWGAITGNTEIRDLGIYLYTTEQSAVEEYWFDIHERNFEASHPYALVSRVWGNSYDNGTFWTNDIEASYGIELYPIHGGSLYLGHPIEYAERLWAEIEQNTPVLNNQPHDNLWYDVMWQYLSFTDPQKAVDLYDSYPDRSLKFGVSDAQTYYWLHAMNAMGQVDASITADYPIAAAFHRDGAYTYAAHNYTQAPITVRFSDGFSLDVPPNTLATNRDVAISGTLSSSFAAAHPGGSVTLTLASESESISKVAFYADGNLLGEVETAPYVWKASQLGAGIYGFYAKMYEGEAFDVSNIVNVVVGRQLPYGDAPSAIPGTIEAGHYDRFEGGRGQGVSYMDVSAQNEGGYRPGEAVDAAFSEAEGATVGWIAPGEWLEYTVQIAQSGLYELTFRFASDNPNGGGPFRLALDGQLIGEDIAAGSTGGWDKWQSKSVGGLALVEGTHVLRVAFANGEFNLARMSFAFQEDLPYSQPVADAGANVVVVLPSSVAQLDGTASRDPGGAALTYAWEQLHGPSAIAFADASSASTQISNLEEGVYECRLTVGNGQYSASDHVLVIVSATGNSLPSVSITSPANNTSFAQGTPIEIEAAASDLENRVVSVAFYDGTTLLGEDTAAPYAFTFADAGPGAHQLTAQATDEDGAVGVSAVVNVNVEEVKSCSETSTQAAEGAFSVGYKATFESVGTTVKVTFELLDTEKVGVVAFLRQENPFTETQMEQVGERTFTSTLGGQVLGSTIRYACKFAYAGGLSVTKYIAYEVGADCEGDTSPPTNFTASVGAITANTIELLLFADDDSETVVYEIRYGAEQKVVSRTPGAQASVMINSLTPATAYSFSITASDLAGNRASAIALSATTAPDTNTPCAGSDFRAQLGAFETGYRYAFETVGTDVNITFELLDAKSDVFAFLWQEDPFIETRMTQVSGGIYTITLSGQSAGTTLRLACKFEFAGGLAVSQYLSYEVGDNCGALGVEDWPAGLSVYPNPASERLRIEWPEFYSASLYTLLGKEVLTSDAQDIPLEHLANGLYVMVITGRNGQRVHVKIVKD